MELRMLGKVNIKIVTQRKLRNQFKAFNYLLHFKFSYLFVETNQS